MIALSSSGRAVQDGIVIAFSRDVLVGFRSALWMVKMF